MGHQHGHILWQSGGACSKCGAEGVTVTTCPFNKSAKNPKPALHNSAPKANAGNANAVKANAVAKKTASKKVVVNDWNALPIAAAKNNINIVKKAAADFFGFVQDFRDGPMAGVGEGDWSDFVEQVMDVYNDAIDSTRNKDIKTFLQGERDDIAYEIMYPN